MLCACVRVCNWYIWNIALWKIVLRSRGDEYPSLSSLARAHSLRAKRVGSRSCTYLGGVSFFKKTDRYSCSDSALLSISATLLDEQSKYCTVQCKTKWSIRN